MWKKIVHYLELIKWEHSIFSFSFFLISMVLTMYSQHIAFSKDTIYLIIWGIVALVAARAGAMSFNRLIDQHIDAQNTRTQYRHLPQGLLSSKFTLLAGCLAFIVLLFAAWQINMTCLYLAPLAIIAFAVYPYTKRFTWLCHYFLGACIAGSVLGTYLLFMGQLQFPLWLVLLFWGVVFWIAGFDIIYAIADMQFDRQYGIYSIPARFGREKALLISFITHIVSIMCFGIIAIILKPLWLGTSLHYGYLLGLFVLAIGILYQHLSIRRQRLSSQQIEQIFFYSNAIAGLAFGIIVLFGYVLLIRG